METAKAGETAVETGGVILTHWGKKAIYIATVCVPSPCLNSRSIKAFDISLYSDQVSKTEAASQKYSSSTVVK